LAFGIDHGLGPTVVQSLCRGLGPTVVQILVPTVVQILGQGLGSHRGAAKRNRE